jgi:hypothetical protein
MAKYGTLHICKKPHRRDPDKTDPLKALTACQSLEAKSQPPSCPSLVERSWVRQVPRAAVCASLEPHDIIKSARPRAPSGMTSASPEGHAKPSSKTGTPTTAPTPVDGMDMTVHSEQEHRNHALTQRDPGHSITTTSIPLQRRG